MGMNGNVCKWTPVYAPSQFSTFPPWSRTGHRFVVADLFVSTDQGLRKVYWSRRCPFKKKKNAPTWAETELTSSYLLAREVTFFDWEGWEKNSNPPEKKKETPSATKNQTAGRRRHQKATKNKVALTWTLSSGAVLPGRRLTFEVPFLGWFPRAKWAQFSWGSGGRWKLPSGVWGSAPEAFENYAFFFSSFDHFHIKSLDFQLDLNCGVFQGQGFVDHKTRCPSRCQSASSRPLLAVLQYGVHLVHNMWLFRLSKRQKRHPFCHCIFVDPLFLMPCMRKCSCAEKKRTKPRWLAQLYQ